MQNGDGHGLGDLRTVCNLISWYFSLEVSCYRKLNATIISLPLSFIGFFCFGHILYTSYNLTAYLIATNFFYNMTLNHKKSRKLTNSKPNNLNENAIDRLIQQKISKYQTSIMQVIFERRSKAFCN